MIPPTVYTPRTIPTEYLSEFAPRTIPTEALSEFDGWSVASSSQMKHTDYTPPNLSQEFLLDYTEPSQIQGYNPPSQVNGYTPSPIQHNPTPTIRPNHSTRPRGSSISDQSQISVISHLTWTEQATPRGAAPLTHEPRGATADILTRTRDSASVH